MDRMYTSSFACLVVSGGVIVGDFGGWY